MVGVLILLANVIFRKGHLEKSYVKKTAVSLAIVIFYFALPVVSRAISNAIKCQAFKTNDARGSYAGSYTSYLVADMSIKCETGLGTAYSKLQHVFWVSSVLWPILTPLAFLSLLIYVRPSVRSNRPTLLNNACRFLWEDYDESMMFWDVVDAMRKIFLTGFIVFIDPNEGSNKTLRLTIASIVSSLYLDILDMSQPFKRKDGYYLTFVSNDMLFSFGHYLQLCNNDITCIQFVGTAFLNMYLNMIQSVGYMNEPFLRLLLETCIHLYL